MFDGGARFNQLKADRRINELVVQKERLDKTINRKVMSMFETCGAMISTPV